MAGLLAQLKQFIVGDDDKRVGIPSVSYSSVGMVSTTELEGEGLVTIPIVTAPQALATLAAIGMEPVPVRTHTGC